MIHVICASVVCSTAVRSGDIVRGASLCRHLPDKRRARSKLIKFFDWRNYIRNRRVRSSRP